MGGSTPLNANIVPTGMVPEEYISVSQALRQYSAIKICSISVVNRRIKLINSKGKNKIFFLSFDRLTMTVGVCRLMGSR